MQAFRGVAVNSISIVIRVMHIACNVCSRLYSYVYHKWKEVIIGAQSACTEFMCNSGRAGLKGSGCLRKGKHTCMTDSSVCLNCIDYLFLQLRGFIVYQIEKIIKVRISSCSKKYAH